LILLDSELAPFPVRTVLYRFHRFADHRSARDWERRHLAVPPGTATPAARQSARRPNSNQPAILAASPRSTAASRHRGPTSKPTTPRDTARQRPLWPWLRRMFRTMGRQQMGSSSSRTRPRQTPRVTPIALVEWLVTRGFLEASLHGFLDGMQGSGRRWRKGVDGMTSQHAAVTRPGRPHRVGVDCCRGGAGLHRVGRPGLRDHWPVFAVLFLAAMIAKRRMNHR
jgi:hypothetical protein